MEFQNGFSSQQPFRGTGMLSASNVSMMNYFEEDENVDKDQFCVYGTCTLARAQQPMNNHYDPSNAQVIDDVLDEVEGGKVLPSDPLHTVNGNYYPYDVTTLPVNGDDDELADINFDDIVEEKIEIIIPHRSENNVRGNWSIDTHDPVIAENQFPKDYFQRLEDFFRLRFLQHRGTCRNASTMVTSNAATPLSCFGVTVRPCVKDAEVNTEHKSTRDFGSTTMQTDAALILWMNEHCKQYNEEERRHIHKLLHSSVKDTREEFVDKIMKFVSNEQPSTISPHSKPEVNEVDLNVQSINIQQSPAGSHKVVDRLVEVRPSMSSKHSMQDTTPRNCVTTQTEPPILRSLGSQITPAKPDITCRGLQVDPMAFKPFTDAPDGTKSENVKRSPLSEGQEQYTIKTVTQRHMYASPVCSLADPYSPDNLYRTVSSPSLADRKDSVKLDDSSFNAIQPVRLQPYFKPRPEPHNDVPVSTSEIGHPIDAKPYQRTESYTISTDQHHVDQVRQRHILPDLDLNTIMGEGRDEAISAALSQSKPLDTKQMLHDFPPEIDVLPVIHNKSSPSEHYFEDKSNASFYPRVASDRISGFHIPITSKSPNRPGSTERAIPITVRKSKEPTPLRSAPSPADSIDIPVGVLQPTSPKQPITSHFFGAERQFTDVQTPQPTRARKSHSRESYSLSPELKEACELMGRYYTHNSTDVPENRLNEEFIKLTHAWFNMTGETNPNLSQLCDYLAILNGYSSQLLCDVVQATGEDGGTCLHYAVGHGAWSVVNLILDYDLAQPNRFNRAGYSPIMIATASVVNGDVALRTLDRLFRIGHLNVRASAGTHKTPLMLAATNGQDNVVKLLLNHGADVNLQDVLGNTAVMCAIENGNETVVRALLQCHELDLSLKDNLGKTAYDIAIAKNNPVLLDLIKRATKQSSSPIRIIRAFDDQAL